MRRARFRRLALLSGTLALLCSLAVGAQMPFDREQSAVLVTGILLPVRDITMSAPIAGAVKHIAFNEGDQVAAGQILLQLDDQADQVEAQRFAQVLEKREYDSNSSQRLFRDNVVSADEVLERKIELNIARLDLQQAQLNIQKKQLVAPFDGILAKLHFDQSEWVQQSQPILEFIDASSMVVRLVVSPALADDLSINQQVLVADASNPEKTQMARLDFIDPRVDAQSGLRRVQLMLDNSNQTWVPGMRVVAQLGLPE